VPPYRILTRFAAFASAIVTALDRSRGPHAGAPLRGRSLPQQPSGTILPKSVAGGRQLRTTSISAAPASSSDLDLVLKAECAQRVSARRRERSCTAYSPPCLSSSRPLSHRQPKACCPSSGKASAAPS